jgi:hypothetical protein
MQLPKNTQFPYVHIVVPDRLPDLTLCANTLLRGKTFILLHLLSGAPASYNILYYIGCGFSFLDS